MTVASSSSNSVEQVSQSVDAVQLSDPTLQDIPLTTATSVHATAKFTGAPMGTSSTTPYPPSMRNSGKAIASLVCSIIGLFVFGVIFGPIAICLAVAALNEIKEKPDQIMGKCMATSGLIIGIIGFILSIVVIVLYYTTTTTAY